MISQWAIRSLWRFSRAIIRRTKTAVLASLQLSPLPNEYGPVWRAKFTSPSSEIAIIFGFCAHDGRPRGRRKKNREHERLNISRRCRKFSRYTELSLRNRRQITVDESFRPNQLFRVSQEGHPGHEKGGWNEAIPLSLCLPYPHFTLPPVSLTTNSGVGCSLTSLPPPPAKGQRCLVSGNLKRRLQQF